jgi:hypothetical protein
MLKALRLQWLFLALDKVHAPEAHGVVAARSQLDAAQCEGIRKSARPEAVPSLLILTKCELEPGVGFVSGVCGQVS